MKIEPSNRRPERQYGDGVRHGFYAGVAFTMALGLLSIPLNWFLMWLVGQPH